jgi:hypothetical protein
MGTVTENGCKTAAQAIPGFTRLYTEMLMMFAALAAPTTTRSTWHGEGKFPEMTAFTWIGRVALTIRRLFAKSKNTLSRISLSSPGWGL